MTDDGTVSTRKHGSMFTLLNKLAAAPEGLTIGQLPRITATANLVRETLIRGGYIRATTYQPAKGAPGVRYTITPAGRRQLEKLRQRGG